MRWRLWGFALASLGLLVMVSGCPPRAQPRQQVAGSEESRQQGGPTQVTITFDDNGITIDPSRIPQGDMQLRLVNNSSRPQSLSTSGGNTRGQTWRLQPGRTATTTIRNPSPGMYQLHMPSGGGQQGKGMQ